jgi:fumarate reductase flavoprotein subunit
MIGNTDYDVVIVGSGMAGSVAAVRAAELGASAIVLDQAEDTTVAGSTVLAGGSVHLVHQPLDADSKILREGIYLQGWDETTPDTVEALVANAARARGWVGAQGVEFQEPEEGGQRGLVPRHCSLSPPKDRGDAHAFRDRGPHRALQVLQRQARAAGAQIHGQTEVRELIQTADGVVGVVTAGGHRVHAGVVVIADGGFGSNPGLRRRFIGPAADQAFLRGSTACTGAGIMMAEAVGARLVNMQWIYGHLMHGDVFTNNRLWPWPLLDGLLARGGILVDRTGSRLVEDGQGGIWAANVLARSANPVGAFLIVDDAIWQESGRTSREPIAANPAFLERGATVHRACGARELAAIAGIDPAGLAQTLAAARPMTGLLLAFPAAAGISYTMGGLAIDAGAHVLDHDGCEIPGLLAAGAAAASPTAGYIGGLATAMIFGLIAGETAARESRGHGARGNVG